MFEDIVHETLARSVTGFKNSTTILFCHSDQSSYRTRASGDLPRHCLRHWLLVTMFVCSLVDSNSNKSHACCFTMDFDNW
jgi:hypothetical protein